METKMDKFFLNEDAQVVAECLREVNRNERDKLFTGLIEGIPAGWSYRVELFTKPLRVLLAKCFCWISVIFFLMSLTDSTQSPAVLHFSLLVILLFPVGLLIALVFLGPKTALSLAERWTEVARRYMVHFGYDSSQAYEALARAITYYERRIKLLKLITFGLLLMVIKDFFISDFYLSERCYQSSVSELLLTDPLTIISLALFPPFGLVCFFRFLCPISWLEHTQDHLPRVSGKLTENAS